MGRPDVQTTLILGGARSGKSDYATRLARRRPGTVTFVATARPSDDEMQERIRAHRRSRPDSWSTIEPPFDLVEVGRRLHPTDEHTVLLDDVSLLVSGWLEQQRSEKEIRDTLERFLCLVQSGPAGWILVSALVNRGIVPSDPGARRFRDLVGRVHQQLAAGVQRVVEVTAGLPRILKGPQAVHRARKENT